MAARIPEAQPPFPGDVQQRLEAMMPKGVAPLLLFTTLARDPRLFKRFLAGSLLDKGTLSLRHREIVIDRITALSRSEYEWGVHVAFFAERAGLDEAQIASTAQSGAADSVWSEPERALLTVCDQLHATCDIDDKAWNDIRRHFPEEAILEILMLAGSYRMVSYLTNALRLPLEIVRPAFSPRRRVLSPDVTQPSRSSAARPWPMAFACLTWAAAKRRRGHMPRCTIVEPGAPCPRKTAAGGSKRAKFLPL